MSLVSARRAYFAAAMALIAIVTIVNLTLPTATGSPTDDVWAHVAALDEWASDLGDPGHSHLPVATPSARFIPPFLPIAALSAAAGWSAVTAYAVAAILAVALLTFVLYAFFRMLLPDEPLAPLVGLGAVLFAWGLSPPWSGMFELRSLLVVSGYPSAWSFAIGLAMVLAAVRSTRDRSPMWLAVTAVLSAMVVVSHPITSIFIFSLAAVVAIDRGWRAFVWPGIAVVVGIALAFAWPFFSLWDVLTEPLAFGDDSRLIKQFYSPVRVIAMGAPAFVGVYALTKLEGRRRVAFTVGAASMAALWLANIVVAVPVGDRFFIFTVFYLHVALVMWLTPMIRDVDPTTTAAAAARMGVVLLIAGHVVITMFDVGGWRLNLSGVTVIANRGESNIVPQMEAITTFVPNDAIVMADESTRWMMPAFSGKVVGVGRDYFGVADAEQRLADAEYFFTTAATPQQRRELLATYDADFILFAPELTKPELIAELEGMGEIAAETLFFVLVTPSG